MTEELKIIISAQTEKFKNSVDKAKQEINGFKEQVQKASKDVDERFKSISKGISSGLKTAATAVAATGTALLALGASTAEYRNEQAKLTTAFEAAGSSASVAKDTYNDLYRVLGDSGQATEAANHLAKLTTNEKDLSEWTNICQGVYATFGDSLPIEGLTEASNETAKVGEVTGSLADALNWAGVSEDDFNNKLAKCNSEADREKLIRETLNGLYSDAASKYEKNNAQVLAQNEAQAKLQDTMARLGEAVAPVVTAFTNFAADALAVVTPYIQDLAETYMPALSEVLETVSDALGDALECALQHKELLAVIGGIIAGVTIAIGLYNAVAAIKAAMDAAQVTTLGALVTAYLAQAAAMIVAIAPYLLIVAAIAAVIAIVVLCVKHWDEIKEAVSNAWETIKEATSTAVDAIVEFFTGLWESINGIVQTGIDAVVGFFTGLWETLQGIWDGICNVINFAIQFIAAIFSTAIQILLIPWQFIWENFGGVLTEKWNQFTEIISSALDAIKNVISTVWNAIVSFLKPILQSIAKFFTTVWNGIKSVTSTVFNAIKTFITNVWNNIKSSIQSVLDAIKSVISSVWEAIKGVVSSVLNAIKSVVGNIWNGIKSVITSVLDTIKSTVSNVFNAVKNTVSSVFNGIKSTATSVWNGIKSAITTPIEAAKNKVKSVVDAIKGFFSGMKLSLPKIKLPHFKVTGKLSISPPSVPKLSISWYKLGGVFDNPTMFGYGNGMLGGLGEDGAEAVVPLEKNTQWLDRLASMLNEKMGGNTPIVLEVDGKVFAETAINTINNNTRQTGKLALNLI